MAADALSEVAAVPAASGGPPRGTTAAIAGWAAEAFAAGADPAACDQAALTLTDTVACALAGARLQGGAIVADVIEALGGAPEAHSLATGERLPAPAAAYVNATLANVADLDDNLLYHVHIACTVVPAALAAAEAVHTDGARLLAAIAVGYEVAARIALAHDGTGRVVRDPPELEIAWPATFGHSGNALGAAVAAGCLHGLDAGGLRHAMGIAAYAAPVPSIAKSVQQPSPPLNRYAAYGAMASGGVLAARLAAAGLTADTDVLDGPGGFWRMAGSQTVDAEALAGALGQSWWIRESSYKREPACSWARPALRALREVLARNPGVEAGEVEEVVVRTHLLSEAPMFLARDVQDYAAAQMSFPFAVAAVIAGLPEERWYDAEAITDPAIAALMARVRIEGNAASTVAVWDQIRDGARPRRVRRIPTQVEVRTPSAVLHGEAEYGDGDPAPGCRLGLDEMRQKFIRHARAALGDRAPAAAQRLLAAATEPSARALAQACAPAPTT